MPYAAEAPRTIELSVAAPAYNEAENIAGVVREWRDYLIRHPAIGRWEIVVCDDGSTDATGAILAGLQRDCPELRVIRFPRNRGAGGGDRRRHRRDPAGLGGAARLGRPVPDHQPRPVHRPHPRR